MTDLKKPLTKHPTKFHKVPEVTLMFWIIKIAATTLGETAGDAVTMSMKLGYLAGTAIFAALFVLAVRAQISAQRLHVLLYWAVIVTTTTVGTTFADWTAQSALDMQAVVLCCWYCS